MPDFGRSRQLGGLSPHATSIGALGMAYEAGGAGTFAASPSVFDGQSWQVPNLAMDSLGGVVLSAVGISLTALAFSVFPTINGALVPQEHWQAYGGVGAPGLGYSLAAGPGADLNAGGGMVGARFGYTLCVRAPHSSLPVRVLEALTWFQSNPTTNAIYSRYAHIFYSGAGEITALGLRSTVAASLSGASVYTIERLRKIP